MESKKSDSLVFYRTMQATAVLFAGAALWSGAKAMNANGDAARAGAAAHFHLEQQEYTRFSALSDVAVDRTDDRDRAIVLFGMSSLVVGLFAGYGVASMRPGEVRPGELEGTSESVEKVDPPEG